MMKQAKKLTNKVFDGAGTAARRVVCTTQDLAEQIGPKRGLIGLAVIGAAIGASVFVTRFLRNRRATTLETRMGRDDRFDRGRRMGRREVMIETEAH